MYQHWIEQSNLAKSAVADFGIALDEYYYVTAHRAENVDSPERLRALVHILESLPCAAIYPVHPRTQQNLKRLKYWNKLRKQHRVHLVDPVPYTVSLALVRGAKAVLTDSGGLQREAYWSGIPCLVLREVTEWPELLASGGGALVGLDPVKAASALNRRWRHAPVADSIFSKRQPARAIVRQMALDLNSK
jgi:UDP-N-acetylglucosamine 2-epimerase